MQTEAFRPRFYIRRFQKLPIDTHPKRGNAPYQLHTEKEKHMRITIFLKDGTFIDDCMIDSIHYEPETDIIQFTDRFGRSYTKPYTKIACIMLKGVASYENS